MKLTVAGIAVALLIALTGCNSDQLPPASANATVTGLVIDAGTSKPVAGAVVTIDTVLTGTTDATGKFTIANVPAGTADYTVEAQGYGVVNASANIEPGKPYELDVALTLTSATPH